MDVLFNDSDNGSFISGSLTLNPTLRTSIVATTSERAYGRTYSLNLAHRTRKSNWSLRYSDDLTTSQQQLLSQVGIEIYICPTGFEVCHSPSIALKSRLCASASRYYPFHLWLTKHTFQKHSTGTVSYRLRRSSFALSILIRNGSSKVCSEAMMRLVACKPPGVCALPPTPLSRSRPASPRMKSVAHPVAKTISGISAYRHTHQFQPKVSGSVEVRHQERKSSDAGYDENSVAARLNMSF
jgi:hypothetical protein